MPLALRALSNESFFPDILVVQDFPVIPEQKSYNLTNGKGVEIVDILGWNLKRGALKGREHLERIYKYRNLADAVEAEEWVLSEGLGRAIGWELDAMKVWPTLPFHENALDCIINKIFLVPTCAGVCLAHAAQEEVVCDAG